MLDKSDIIKYITPLQVTPTYLSASGKPPLKIKAILFDIYGTLFISGSGDICASKKAPRNHALIQHILQKYGRDISPQQLVDEFHQRIEKEHDKLRGIGIEYPEVKFDLIWMELLGFRDLETARDFAVEFELIMNPVYPMPHLSSALAYCRSMNLIMGIISNAQFFTPLLFPWLLDADLDNLGFHPDLRLFSYEFDRAKPSPELFQAAADKLAQMGVNADSVLYLGNDMLNDIYPADHIGFKTALFAGDARSLRLREEFDICRDLAPDLIVSDLEQLSAFIQADNSIH